MAWDGYKSKRWRRLRRSILRRDGYRCREWARYGKAVEATTVHHVWPAEEYPEYAWAPWNLVSLSGDRHDATVVELDAAGKVVKAGSVVVASAP